MNKLSLEGDELRNRAAVILFNENNEIALIKRIRDGYTYYVFPGGGIEKTETPETAAEREAFEELGLMVKVKECLMKVRFRGTQHFFLADILGGEFGSGNGEEFSDKNKDRGLYLPLWMKLERLPSIDVRPKEVACKVMSQFK